MCQPKCSFAFLFIQFEKTVVVSIFIHRISNGVRLVCALLVFNWMEISKRDKNNFCTGKRFDSFCRSFSVEFYERVDSVSRQLLFFFYLFFSEQICWNKKRRIFLQFVDQSRCNQRNFSQLIAFQFDRNALHMQWQWLTFMRIICWLIGFIWRCLFSGIHLHFSWFNENWKTKSLMFMAQFEY